MSLDKKVILNETAHLESSPAVREAESDEKHVVVVPSGPGKGGNKPKNILAGISKEDLLNDVRSFAAEKGLEEYLPDLEKGALLAQRPDDFEEISELTEEDIVSIRYEKEHKWSHPLWLWLTIIVCSTGEFLLGSLGHGGVARLAGKLSGRRGRCTESEVQETLGSHDRETVHRVESRRTSLKAVDALRLGVTGHGHLGLLSLSSCSFSLLLLVLILSRWLCRRGCAGLGPDRQ